MAKQHSQTRELSLRLSKLTHEIKNELAANHTGRALQLIEEAIAVSEKLLLIAPNYQLSLMLQGWKDSKAKLQQKIEAEGD